MIMSEMSEFEKKMAKKWEPWKPSKKFMKELNAVIKQLETEEAAKGESS